MSQSTGGSGRAARFSFRFIAMIIGLVGAVVALVILLLYSAFSVLGKVTGFSNDTASFFYGLFVVMFGAVGAFLAPLLPLVSGILLIVAGIGFFFAVGWWALVASPFFIVAGIMTFSNQRVNLPETA